MTKQNSDIAKPLNETFKLRKRWILSTLVFLFFVIVTTLSFEKIREKKVYATTLNALQASNQALADQLSDNILAYKDKLLLLSELPSVRQFILYQTQLDSAVSSDKPPFSKDNLHTSFTAFLNNDPSIRQARLILTDGMEFVRVQRSEKDIFAVSQSLLQSKQNRDYFKIGMRLEDESVYISDISPNYEYGKIELPLWPTFRVIKKLKTLNGYSAGILVLNIDATELIKKLNNSLYTANLKLEHYLLDKDGFYLGAPKTDMLFGEDLRHPEMNWFTHTDNTTPLSSFLSFETLYQKIPYLFSSKEIHFSNNKESLPYYLISGISKNHIEQEIKTLRMELYISISVISLLLLLSVLWSIKYFKVTQTSLLKKSYFQAIVDNSDDAILSIDLSGMILSWNKAATFLLGLSSNEKTELNLFEILDEKTPNQLNPDFLKETINKQIPLKLEVSLKNNHKHKRSLLAVFKNIEGSNKSPESLVVIIRDITHQKAHQQKLEATNASLELKLNKYAAELENEKQKILNASLNKSMFIANISHEIRTPLNAINGLLSLARESNNQDKRDEYLILAQESTKTLNTLINDLIDLSKIESGKLELDFKPTNLTPLLESVISESTSLLKDKDIELILDTSLLEVTWIITDEIRLKQILSNLIQNAIKFTRSGSIVLSAKTFPATFHANEKKQKPIECEFKVIDSGIGMSKEQQDKLFKPFSQASTSISNTFGSSGLGLSISKQLCERMEGILSLTSQLGQGSTFRVSFIATQYLTKIAERLEQTINLGKLTILLLIQNERLRHVLDKQCRSWLANVDIIERAEDILTLIKKYSSARGTQCILIFDDNLMSEDLQSQLPESLPKVHVLKHFNAKTNTQYFHLPKPVLPSALFKLLLSIQNNEESISTNLTPLARLQHANSDSPLNNPFEKHRDSYLVFVVDDNEINRIVGSGILSVLPVKLETAISGLDLLNKLRSIPINSAHILILMDCQMPEIDGYEATRQIRSGNAGEWLKQIKIIAVTSDVMPYNKAQCEEAGMNGFISKPFDPDNLKEVVLDWIQKNPE